MQRGGRSKNMRSVVTNEGGEVEGDGKEVGRRWQKLVDLCGVDLSCASMIR